MPLKLHKVLLIPRHSSDSPGDCHLTPPFLFLLPPPRFLRPLQPILSGPWLSHISALCILEAAIPPPLPPPSSSSSSWSYLKLHPALARVQSDSSSALAGFPEHPRGSCEGFLGFLGWEGGGIAEEASHLSPRPAGGGGAVALCALCVPGSSGFVSDVVDMFLGRKQKVWNCGRPHGVQRFVPL